MSASRSIGPRPRSTWAMRSERLESARQERPGWRRPSSIFREALTENTRDRVPLDWAKAQTGLGNTLRALGERDGRTASLDDAIAAIREALKENTRERAPLDWARTQTSLGNALQTVGARESGTARLEEAIAAYRSALTEQSRDRAPLDWASTETNLGAALVILGEREKCDDSAGGGRRRPS